MTVTIREPTLADLLTALPSTFVGKPEFVHTLSVCYTLSTSCWLGSIDGETVCAWGLIPPSILSQRAYIWLITTDKVEEHQFTFVRQSQIWIGYMLNTYPTLCGHAEIGNKRGIRWLKWLGARFGQPDNGKIPFEIRKERWQIQSRSRL